jgi:hypothetical protein
MLHLISQRLLFLIMNIREQCWPTLLYEGGDEIDVVCEKKAHEAGENKYIRGDKTK